MLDVVIHSESYRGEAKLVIFLVWIFYRTLDSLLLVVALLLFAKLLENERNFFVIFSTFSKIVVGTTKTSCETSRRGLVLRGRAIFTNGVTNVRRPTVRDVGDSGTKNFKFPELFCCVPRKSDQHNVDLHFVEHFAVVIHWKLTTELKKLFKCLIPMQSTLLCDFWHSEPTHNVPIAWADACMPLPF